MSEQFYIKSIDTSRDFYKQLFSDSKNKPARLIIMIGGAAYKQSHGTKDFVAEDLLRLTLYLKEIGAHKKKEDEDTNPITVVLCFDELYGKEHTADDIDLVNKAIYEDRFYNGKTKKFLEGISNSNIEDNYTEYITTNSYYNSGLFNENTQELIQNKDQGVRVLGDLVFIDRFYFNLTTQYLEKKDELVYNHLGKPVSEMAAKCVPKSNTAFASLKEFCETIDFQEYYIYNRAWVGGGLFFQKDQMIYKSPSTVHNVYFETMCELLYIIQGLHKPSFFLTSGYTDVVNHKDKKTKSFEIEISQKTRDNNHKPRYYANYSYRYKQSYPSRSIGKIKLNINIVPFDETTSFKKEKWSINPLRGGRRTATRKQKKRSRRNRK